MPGRPLKPSNPNGAGRPAKPIDPKMLEKLCSIGATLEEIGAVFDLHHDSIRDRVSKSPVLQQAMAKGRGAGKVTLRRMQFDLAKKGNATMLVWLGKQLLGQRDFHEIEHSGTVEVTHEHILKTANDRALAFATKARGLIIDQTGAILNERDVEDAR